MTLPAGLPQPDPTALEHSIKVANNIAKQINSSPDKRISFEHWMDMALYEPGLGYYVAGSTKIANQPEADFTTAPELSPIFGHVVAQQVKQVIEASSPNILEFGAGTGALAHAVLQRLHTLGIKAKYYILEVSPELQQRQKHRLAEFETQVEWITSLPYEFSGCVLANEVLDAMPVQLFQWGTETNPSLYELYVSLQNEQSNNTPVFKWDRVPACAQLEEAVKSRMPALPGYTSEVNLRANAWIKQMGSWLKQGAALIFDYGFPQAEYYHPQRAEGTLMCHFRHHTHANPLVLPGIQDITAHIDFTSIADAALEGNMEVAGYTSQANFLINSGLMQLLQELHANSDAQYQAQTMAIVQKLLSEAEMGELFKVIALTNNLDHEYPLIGFAQSDRRHRL